MLPSNQSKAPSLAPAVFASALVKSFGSTRAVDGLDINVPGGSIYGVLGPNGAGKTTMLRMLATLLRPDGGTARVLGHDVVREADAVRRRISVTGQFASLDLDLTGRENLLLLARVLGYRRRAAGARADELLEAFGLTDAARRPAKSYSGGMRRRLDVAASIVVTPDLLFLDEPTTGLDPRSRNEVWQIVRALARRGTTILLTTQYLDEADQLADSIAVIDHGAVIAEGTPSALKASVGGGTLRVRLDDSRRRADAASLLEQTLGGQVHAGTDDAELTLRPPDPGRVPGALASLVAAGIALAEFALGQPTLDEVFLALIADAAPRRDGDREEQAA